MTKKLYPNDGGTGSPKSNNTIQKAKSNKLFFILVGLVVLVTLLVIIFS